MSTERLDDLLTCELCYAKSADVKRGLGLYRTGGEERFQDIDRCVDHTACRTRVETAGRQWPLAERSA